MNAPQTPQDALTLALKLAILAPSRGKSEAATVLAERIASQMTEIEVARCKRRALRELGEAA